MSALLLSREGVFPIAMQADGQLADKATGLDVAGTIQGEGKLVGVPSLFVRLQGCNLRCEWTDIDGNVCRCDTSHTSFGDAGGASRVDVQDVMKLLRLNMGCMSHVVVTGGEPMLQLAPLRELVKACRQENWHVTIETNGTIFDEEVVKNVSLMSISPKLPSSVADTDYERLTIVDNLVPLKNIVEFAKKNGVDVQLKFVVASARDEQEIRNRLAAINSGLESSDVIVMPMGVSREQIALSTSVALPMAIRNGWRFTPRLHIDLFGNKEGV